MQSGYEFLLSGQALCKPETRTGIYLLRRRHSTQWSLPKVTVRAVLESVLLKRELVRAHRPRDADNGYAKVPPTEDQMHRIMKMRIMYQEKHDMPLR